jgi:hypothetical protein
VIVIARAGRVTKELAAGKAPPMLIKYKMLISGF